MNRRDHEVVVHHTWLRRLARRLARSRSRADDLIQDTYLIALRKAPPDGKLQPWLQAVMRKLAWGQVRSERRRTHREQAFAQIAPSPTALADALLDDRIERDRLAAALARVPEPFKSTLVQRFLEGRSCADIARSANVPAGTVRWRQMRGLELLRAQLEPRRRQRAVWAVPFLGAGGPVALRTWNRLVSPWSGKALWLWLAVAVMTYAVGRSSRPPQVMPAAIGAATALEHDGVPVVRGSSAAGGVRADGAGGPRDPAHDRAFVPPPAGGVDEVPSAVRPGTAAPASLDRALAAPDRPLDARVDDCRWEPEVGWRCPPPPHSSAASRTSLLCGLLPQLGSAMFAHGDLARQLGCRGPRATLAASSAPGGRLAGGAPAGGGPGSDGGKGEPACTTEARADGVLCTVCPGQLPVCAATGCHSYTREDGTPCTVCFDAAGSAQTACPSAASRLPAPCFSRSAFGGNVVLLDPTTETIVYTSMTLAAVDLSSLAWTRNHLLGCDWVEARLLILDLATGETTSVARDCDAVTSMGDQIYVQTLFGRSLHEYPDLAALIEDRPARVLPGPYATRLGAGHGRLLAAWHSDHEVLAVDLATASSEPIPLPDYDGWIYGLFENADVRLVMPGLSETGIHLYDTGSGQPVGKLFDGVPLEGLTCATGRP